VREGVAEVFIDAPTSPSGRNKWRRRVGGRKGGQARIGREKCLPGGGGVQDRDRRRAGRRTRVKTVEFPGNNKHVVDPNGKDQKRYDFPDN